MTNLRVFGSALAVLGAALAGVAVAGPAQAATIDITDANCTSGENMGTSVTASPGDVLNITGDLTSCNRGQVHVNLVVDADFISSTPIWGSSTATGGYYDFTASGAFTSFQVTVGSTPGVYTMQLSASGNPRTFWVVTVTAPAPDDGDSSGSMSEPAPVIQQFGKPAVGTCEAAAPAELNWSGVPGGGWGESWSQWMNAGTGGAVCTRTLVYSPRGMWVVA